MAAIGKAPSQSSLLARPRSCRGLSRRRSSLARPSTCLAGEKAKLGRVWPRTCCGTPAGTTWPTRAPIYARCRTTSGTAIPSTPRTTRALLGIGSRGCGDTLALPTAEGFSTRNAPAQKISDQHSWPLDRWLRLKATRKGERVASRKSLLTEEESEPENRLEAQYAYSCFPDQFGPEPR